MNDVLIIGAGLAGLMAGLQATRSGKQVNVMAKGWGATHWLSGCIDVLGYYPVDDTTAVTSPAAAVARLIEAEPHHPYALVGLERLEAALDLFKAVCAEAGYPMQGSLDRNWLLPSGVGTFRPTCLAPETMLAGDLSQDTPMLIVGFKQLMDFFPNVVADNLDAQGIPASYAVLDLKRLEARNFTTPMKMAQLMEDDALLQDVVAALRPQLGSAARVGFPAVLGLDKGMDVKQRLESALQRPVFEIPSITPSVPGIRLHRILSAAIVRGGGRVDAGLEALGAETDGKRVTAVHSQASARTWRRRADQVILATGGLLGGGITTDYAGSIREVIFDLPVTAPESRVDWFHRDFLDKRGHPIYRSGIKVNTAFQPVNGGGAPLYDNLYVAGTTLAHNEVIRERSFEGVALSTGYAAAQML